MSLFPWLLALPLAVSLGAVCGAAACLRSLPLDLLSGW